MEAELGYRGNLKRLGLRAFALIAVFFGSGLFHTSAGIPAMGVLRGFSYANVGLGPQANLFGP